MDINTIQQRLNSYARVDIRSDLKHLRNQEKQMINELVSAGKIVDDIFWKQSSHDALRIREQYYHHEGPIREYIEINYGPYDRLHDQERFVGEGPVKKPLGAGFYPENLTHNEFLGFVEQHPNIKEAFESLYTVIKREKGKLIAVPYSRCYETEIKQIRLHLEKAAQFSSNPSFNTYLIQRAQDLQSDNYFKSDHIWLELKDNEIDLVIGPIENYEDRLFNFKAAFEAAIMIKDIPASKELDLYKTHLNNLEKNLPIDDQYKRDSIGVDNKLEIVNIIYFGGDYQVGVKTIAASLPNDEKVISEKGAKKQLYKNIMEAKFDNILFPIADVLIEKKQRPYLSKERFLSQVLLHEISHTIGPNYVAGSSETVRRSLRDKYAIIEECKADILGIFSLEYLKKVFSIDKNDVLEHYITFTAGLFRSIRFGVEEAHGLANLIQLNFFQENGIIIRENSSGKYNVDPEKFHSGVSELAERLLRIEVNGDYNEAESLIENYGNLKEHTIEDIERLKTIPSDLNLTFQINM
jgi:hypothetical protein